MDPERMFKGLIEMGLRIEFVHYRGGDHLKKLFDLIFI